MTAQRIRRQLPTLFLVILIAAAVRIAWIIFVHPNPADGRFDDTAWYYAAARFFAHGDGYVNPFTGTPTAAWPPGYPVALGVLFKIAGTGTTQAYAANVVLATATVAVVYAIAHTLFDRRTALVAALALALWPGQIYFSSLTLSEPLFTFLFALGFLLIVLVPRAGAWRGTALLALGVVVGAAALTRGQALILLPLALAGWGMAGYRWRPAFAWVALAGVAAALVIAPWVVRNDHQLGSPVLISTNLGPNLWIGNHSDATGRMGIPEADPPLPQRGTLTQPQYEVKADQLALRKGLSYMLSHPVNEVRLAGAKIRAMYESDATALDWNAAYRPDYYASPSVEHGLRNLANGVWFAAIALAAVGLVATRRQLGGLAGLLPLTVLAWTAAHVVFFGDARFHYPVVFAIAVLGARGVVELVAALRSPERALGGRYAEA
ncbi:MAG TPA: glycosyltransferase family 39 protein [Dehalococcoidia bacterium]|nr:glycosyltransferase family 39 protein [Dehalococcoidia bacterium]